MWDNESLAALMEPAVGKIFRYIRRGLTEEARAHALTFTQVNALRFLWVNGPMRMNELAGMLELSGSACTAMVEQLEKRGLLEKRLDAADRRATLVSNTADGEVLARQITHNAYRHVAEGMQQLGVAERYMVLAGFEALASVID